jgi:hypothetical protein
LIRRVEGGGGLRGIDFDLTSHGFILGLETDLFSAVVYPDS